MSFDVLEAASLPAIDVDVLFGTVQKYTFTKLLQMADSLASAVSHTIMIQLM